MKIFLSATSEPFKACREQVRSDLSAIGHEVRVQEDFQTGTGSLLQRIQDYVAACDRVIVIVGHAYGTEASGDRVPVCDPLRSHTQWEYFFAIGERLQGSPVERRPLHVYFASDAFRAAHPVHETSALEERQAMFAAAIRSSGQHWAEFSDVDRLRALVLRDINQIDAKLPPLVDDATIRALSELEAEIQAGRGTSSVTDGSLARVRQHSPRNAREHRLHRIATWCDAKYAVDSRFTRLTLLLDQGRAEQRRWREQPESFHDLRAVLAKLEGTAQVLVLLGPPGSGKSTLLRRLELDVAMDAAGPRRQDEGWTFFASLASYKAPLGQPLPEPQQWLHDRWAGDFPHLPSFDEVIRSGRLTLLLDALNEMPHASREDYADRVSPWRPFVSDLVRRAPATRVVFTCRSLDYSELLSTEDLSVPQIRIERLANEQVHDFLIAHSQNHGERLWRQLEGSPQLDLFRSPYYLRLLIDQAGSDGTIPEGRAALFTGFVRQALAREVANNNPLFRAGALLDERDHGRVTRREWRDVYALPSRGPLMPSLAVLAFSLQERRRVGEVSQVRTSYDEAIRLLGPNRSEDLLRAAVALQVLEDDRPRDEVLFVHQLLQEYFAARAVANTTDAAASAKLAAVPWRERDLAPVEFKSDNEPLPPAPPTGWEETFQLAAAMVKEPDRFLTALMVVNLPLAGRCAAQPDVQVSSSLRATLQEQLLERSRDSGADLRSRIAAARSLGELGDPRFERRTGPFGDYILPLFVEIPVDEYPIGSDNDHDDERPAHRVKVERFEITVCPVTNAEWRLFMAAQGDEDDRWWDTETAKRWRRGEGTSEGPKTQQRENRQFWQKNFKRIRELQREGRFTSKQADDWEAIARMSDEQFESLLNEWYPGGRQVQPASWNDPAYNHPSQPVVGICWYEARAYCAWLSGQTGETLALPSEAQWEAAARGREGWRYAWGPDFDATRCNTFETHVRGTTPVGVFPRGDTPRGLTDMTGNLWDWTSSADRPYPYVVDDGREDATRDDVRRVVRGGSWYASRDYARASSRNANLPFCRYPNIGFRVVRVSPIR